MRRSRVGASAGVLLASVAALSSLGGLHAKPAVAAPLPPKQTHAADDTAVQSPGKERVTAAVLSLDGRSPKPLLNGKDASYDTASIVKVDILAALLLQSQDAGRHLTAQERALAEPMIRNSDNAATNALWREIGGAPGLEAANKRIGMTATKGGHGPKWGLTQTTASDQIRLLRCVFGGAGPSKADLQLNKESRAYIQSLMTRVASDQSWGVSAASGSSHALKNGWLQRTASGLWDTNSVGRVTVDGHSYLVAVLSDGSPSMNEGISVVERAAKQAVAAATIGA
ncbi:class A beta-lactamase-related serine hydrolase [Streptomyces sp. KA12]|uniref:serine hydrolase n=1 Tax=Streptomyces sp. KA12 TaxID=2991730 RepID=UPI0023AEB62E|nr:serine hydrolase [Streptomyces sp. KA12]MDF0376277.1 class A beta-lactamase-related serine hydrolase [Streptomyces sp. KA12]